MKKAKYLLSEFLRMLFLLFGVSILAFILIAKAPIDPLVSYIGTESTLSPEAKDEIAAYWGLNESLPVRYLTWLKNICRGEMGESITYKKPVAQVIGERFSYSVVLMLLAWLLSGIFGFLAGIFCGMRRGSLPDRIIKGFCLILKSAPTFWLGLLMLTVFAVRLQWFPIGMAAPLGKRSADVTFADRVYHLVLPVLTLTLVSISDVVLYTRQKLIEIIESDYILYARARGETKGQMVRRHIIRNIALPAVTVQFASFGELFGGMALAENVFSYPGIGTATTAAALSADVPLLLGIALCSAAFVFAGNLIANLLYGVFDPRIGGEGSNG